MLVGGDGARPQLENMMAPLFEPPTAPATKPYWSVVLFDAV